MVGCCPTNERPLSMHSVAHSAITLVLQFTLQPYFYVLLPIIYRAALTIPATLSIILGFYRTGQFSMVITDQAGSSH